MFGKLGQEYVSLYCLYKLNQFAEVNRLKFSKGLPHAFFVYNIFVNIDFIYINTLECQFYDHTYE
jgi:hypothetical protein